MYRLNGQPLQPIHEWVRSFAWTWEQRFDRVDEVLRDLGPRDLKPREPGEMEDDDGGTGK
jgi:hypothetical protein